jgi:hypothetical protein
MFNHHQKHIHTNYNHNFQQSFHLQTYSHEKVTKKMLTNINHYLYLFI